MKRQSYQDRTATFLGLAIAYVIAANALGPLGANRSELFPFFNWSLFTSATSEQWTDAAIYIEGLGGRELPEPMLVYRLKGQLKGIGDGISLMKSTRVLALAIAENDLEKVTSVRNVIERTYLRGPERIRYSVRLIKYKPLERYRTGKITPYFTVGTFEKSD